MSAKYFLDTNILAYCFDAIALDKAAVALRLIDDGLAHRTAVVSYQVAQEFFNVAFRRFKPAMTAPEAERYLDSVFRRLPCVQSSIALCGSAIKIRDLHRLSWWDSLIVSAALEAGCQILYTEDLQHGQKFGGLVVRNPFL